MDFKEKQDQIMKRLLEYRKRGHRIPGRRIIKSPEQIAGIRESGKVNTAVLDYIEANIRPGMSTGEIDRMVFEKTKEMGGIPAPLNYQGFPKSVCTSLNNEICHGIPSDDIILTEGDIVNVDVSTIYKDYFSDSSRMFCIGKVHPEAEKLVRVTKECVERGIEQVKPWGFLGDIGQAVNDHARANGYSVVEDIGGHGVGLEFHEDPYVSFVTKKGTEMVLAPGMVFTIEPMVNMGGPDFFIDEENGWTVYTDDDSLSAQWEVTIAVTDIGHEILAW